MTQESFDVVVIGGGTAGLVTSSGCARLGLKVAMIEREALGGDCLWTGCVPTKALVASAKLAHQMKHASRYGFPDQDVQISPREIMESMRGRQKHISRHDDPEKFRGLGIDVIHGEARFVSPYDIEVDGRRLVAKHVVIATGARTFVPPIEGLEQSGFLDHASFLAQDEFPKDLVVIGGGAIGVEFAQMFSRFGSKVTLVEPLPTILFREDQDVIARMTEILEEEGVNLHTGWLVKKVRTEVGRKIVTIAHKDGRAEEITTDEVFVSAGRRGNIEGLALDVPGVRTEKSYVVVDEYLRTNVPRIWAVGDIKGPPQFTHVAAYEAVKLVRNMLFPGKSKVDYSDVPWAVYSDPEVGHIGLTESEAYEKYGESNVRVYKVEMDDVDRAVVDRTPKGFLKIIVDRKGRIIGAHALSSSASTLIEVLVLARKKGLKIGELAGLVSPYPSLADAVGKAAAVHYQGLAETWLGSLAKRIAAWSI